jgi:hypothetical protein
MSQVTNSSRVNSVSVRSTAAALNWHAFTTTPKHHASTAAAYKNFAAYEGRGAWSAIG